MAGVAAYHVGQGGSPAVVITVTVPRPRLEGYRPDCGMPRSAGFSILAMLVVGGIYESTSHSLPLATAAVLAVSTAAGMHARLAIGRSAAGAQIVACGVLLTLLGRRFGSWANRF